jgi:Exopolyphosphatase-related proteins
VKTLYPPINPVILETIGKAEEIAVFGHTNPDGDCIMSELAIAYLMEKLGKKVHLYNEGPFNRTDINPYKDRFKAEVEDEVVAKMPLVIIVDCSSIDRPGAIFDKVKDLERIVLDHHSSGTGFCRPELSYIVKDSVSTTLLVDRLRMALGIPLTRELAYYLYVGFCTDTGFFHYLKEENAAESLEAVLTYVKAGINPYDVYDELNDGKELDYYKKIAQIVDRTGSLYDGKVLYTWTTKEEVTTDSVSDAIYQQLLTIKDVKVVFFFKEKEDRTVIGMRSKKKSNVDIGAFAQRFDGGGHRFAAGATLHKPLEETMPIVLKSIESLV